MANDNSAQIISLFLGGRGGHQVLGVSALPPSRTIASALSISMTTSLRLRALRTPTWQSLLYPMEAEPLNRQGREFALVGIYGLTSNG